MIKNLSWSTLFMVCLFIISTSGETHWGWYLARFVCAVLWTVCFGKAYDKEQELIKRIEELEEIYKEKE